jgi:hypothetical protein
VSWFGLFSPRRHSCLNDPSATVSALGLSQYFLAVAAKFPSIWLSAYKILNIPGRTAHALVPIIISFTGLDGSLRAQTAVCYYHIKVALPASDWRSCAVRRDWMLQSDWITCQSIGRINMRLLLACQLCRVWLWPTQSIPLGRLPQMIITAFKEEFVLASRLCNYCVHTTLPTDWSTHNWPVL